MALEYDGQAFHKTLTNKKRDLEKYKLCNQNSVTLIRIREPELESSPEIADKIFHLKNTSKEELNNAIKNVLLFLGIMYDVDVIRDEMEIYKTLLDFNYSRSLYAKAKKQKFHNVLTFFKKEMNNGLTLQDIPTNSKTKLFFLCNHGHQFSKSACEIKNDIVCPYCSFVSFEQWCNISDNKRMIKEWSSKNIYSPSEISYGDAKTKIKWECTDCGNEWETDVHHRSLGRGCPQCAQKLTRIQTKHLKEWCEIKGRTELLTEYDKNNAISIKTISASSKIEVDWICSKCGYKWKKSPLSRAYSHTGCPNCSNRKQEIILSI